MRRMLFGVVLLSLLVTACSKSGPEKHAHRIISERIVEVSSENPSYVDEDGETIQVTGIQPGKTIQMKVIRSQLQDGRCIELTQIIPEPAMEAK